MEQIDLYLVRIWRGLSRFRATAQRVSGEGESQVCGSPEELTRLIATGARPVQAPQRPPTGDRPDAAAVTRSLP